MLVSIGRQVALAVENSRKFSEVQEKAETIEANYTNLQQANTELAKRAEILEQQIEEMYQAEQQIWTALAASQKAAHRTSGSQNEELATILKRVLATMSQQRKEKREVLSQIA